MPIHHAIWRVSDPPKPLGAARLVSEQQLEDMIVRDSRILSNEWMLIGRQVPTQDGGRIDLLAIAPDGSLVLIELKRERTPREVVGQALDYASWVAGLSADRVEAIFARFSPGTSLDDAFAKRFGKVLDEASLNQSHQIILVAAKLDSSTERIVAYLSARDIAINVLFFQVFEHNDELLLSRAWLLDPGETQANVAQSILGGSDAGREPWNGEFYVSFGSPESRSWEDARKFGFISAGGGAWYSRTLKMLQPGDRVWVNMPEIGYVGVGRVAESVQPVDTFMIRTEHGEQPAWDVLQHGPQYRAQAEDPDVAEYFVRVNWLDTRASSSAVHEVGFFGNQNSVCKPTTPKWRHTVERLKLSFPRWEA